MNVTHEFVPNTHGTRLGKVRKLFTHIAICARRVSETFISFFNVIKRRKYEKEAEPALMNATFKHHLHINRARQ